MAIPRGDKKPRAALSTRAALVFAFLLTQGDATFQQYFLSAVAATIEHWLSRFRTGTTEKAKAKGGRPATDEEIVKLVVLFKPENPGWG